MRTEYKQQIHNIDYEKELLNFTLTKDEWSWANCWVSGMHNGCERLGKEWFQDLNQLYIAPIQDELFFSGKDYKYDFEYTGKIPRQLLRMFVFSIGRIAYSFDVKIPTSVVALKIVTKIQKQIEEQLPADDKWFQQHF